MSIPKNAMTPITIDTFKVSTAATLSTEAKKAATEKVLADLMTIRQDGDRLQGLRASLAQHVWEGRLCFTHKGKDGTKRPDYNGQSVDYGNWYRALMVKAGFKITEEMTPFEQHSMRIARQQVGAAIRYELRKLADKALTPAQLRSAGFAFSTALGDDQKLGEEDKRTRTVRLISVGDEISNAIVALTNAAARPVEVRELTNEEKADYLEKLSGVAGIVATLLKPSATASAPDLGDLLEASAVQVRAKRTAKVTP